MGASRVSCGCRPQGFRWPLCGVATILRRRSVPTGFGWGWWPRMRRTALLYLVPAALVVSGWLAVEKPVQGGRAFVLAGLALVPALVQPLRLRALAVLGVSAPAAWIALGVPIFQRHDFFGPLGSRFGKGFMEYYDFALPLDPHVHPRMHQALLAGIFLFCLAVGLAIAARRPLAAGLAVVVGAGWSATLLPGGSALLRARPRPQSRRARFSPGRAGTCPRTQAGLSESPTSGTRTTPVSTGPRR